MYAKYFKRMIDFCLSLIGLIVLSPLLLLLMLLGAVFMGGNPFFTQERPGKDEKIFKLIKFRTMDNRRDKDGDLLPDEVRLNKYGRFLRSTSLDELPELINILKGDMAIVGPRPLLVRYLERYNEEQHHRHDVRPGLTGYAQAHGRNAISWEDKFAMDVWYTKHITFLGDIKILIDTVMVVFKRSGVSSETSATMEEFMGTPEGVVNNWRTGVEHLVYASSSSVYGTNKKVPYSTEDKVDNPVSLYAATKKSNELMAHAYSKLYNIPSTGLRFFTVYGPAGRPDMAYFGFTNKLRNNETIQIFNYGNCKRDFTYVDDIVEGVKRVMQAAPEKKTGEDGLPVPPYSVYNIGNNQPENLLDFVDILQQELIRAGVLPADYDFEAHKKLVPMQPGDVPVTYADTKALEEDFGFKPNTSLRDGLRKFAEWYKEFYM